MRLFLVLLTCPSLFLIIWELFVNMSERERLERWTGCPSLTERGQLGSSSICDMCLEPH